VCHVSQTELPGSQPGFAPVAPHPRTAAGTTHAFDINPSDRIVGSSNGRAFLWDNGVMTDLGSPSPEFILSAARAINRSGQVVGSSEIAGERLIRGFFWDRGVMTVLEPLDQGHASTAHNIDARGQIVGESSTASGAVHATLWSRT
jgi:probable HAF family extracellular repeat protein